jgi:hypothetical protein
MNRKIWHDENPLKIGINDSSVIIVCDVCNLQNALIFCRNYYFEKLNRINTAKFKSSLLNTEKLILNRLNELKDNNNIVVKPPDKNLGLCVLSTDKYIELCRNIFKLMKK